MTVSPLTIQIAIAIHVSHEWPEQFFPGQSWWSEPAKAAREWLRDNGMVSAEGAPTDKLAAWVSFICATPLPVQEWRLPEREERL